jgi:SDR family mycofactocin-dependent oxidoreductase
MGRVDGKVALITGAARGQGRAHALRLAEEGADIIAFDICAPVPGVAYEAASEDDLAETVWLVESQDRRILALVGDVRSAADVGRVVAEGIAEFGNIDVLVANAGVAIVSPAWEMSEADWTTVLDVNLSGAWRVAKAVVPRMIEAGKGGSIVFTTSGTAARGVGGMAAYAATKSGLEALCRELAIEGGPHGIRVNTLQPTAVETVMMDNQPMWELFTPGQDSTPLEDRRQAMLDIMSQGHALDDPWVQPRDLANGVLFLASDESRMVTGGPFRVDAGWAAH